MISRIKGTQDFIDLTLFNFIIDQARKHLELYSFSQIETPLLEPTELFKRSLGLQTDVVGKEMYTVNTGPHGDDICLRPEATAAIVRAFIENHIQQTPWKVFLAGAMFRHERPQKGRYRQFHQISIEVIGAAAVMQDVQFIVMLDHFFGQKLLIPNYVLQLNFLGCPEDRARHKIALKEFLLSDEAHIICNLCKDRSEKNIMRIFDCKNEVCQKLYTTAPRITDYLCGQCSGEWSIICEQLNILGVKYSHQPTLVRGLDYYNKIVFEFVSNNLGAQNTFCAGGRYDQLITQIGGKTDQPSLGAAMGIERLMLLLEDHKDLLVLPKKPVLHLIMPMGHDEQLPALTLANSLRSQGLAVDVMLEGDSIKSMMKKADKINAHYALIIGSDEQQAHEVTIKNMVTGESYRVKQADALSALTS